MKTNELLANVRVASPCSARWGHMVGNDRARFCNQCQKHVFNLSGMTAEAAATLILQKEGKLCARFYQRADGMVLTEDCPVGAGRVWNRVKRLIQAAAVLAVVSLALPFVVQSAEADDVPRARSRLYQAWDQTLVTIKTWLGYPPPVAIMGMICVNPPPPSPPSPPTAEQ